MRGSGENPSRQTRNPNPRPCLRPNPLPPVRHAVGSAPFSPCHGARAAEHGPPPHPTSASRRGGGGEAARISTPNPLPPVRHAAGSAPFSPRHGARAAVHGPPPHPTSAIRRGGGGEEVARVSAPNPLPPVRHAASSAPFSPRHGARAAEHGPLPHPTRTISGRGSGGEALHVFVGDEDGSEVSMKEWQLQPMLAAVVRELLDAESVLLGLLLQDSAPPSEGSWSPVPLPATLQSMTLVPSPSSRGEFLLPNLPIHAHCTAASQRWAWFRLQSYYPS